MESFSWPSARMSLLVVTTGDYTPDMRALLGADVIICTPEKWDGISRSWQNRAYVMKVALLVIDEIHLLGADRSVHTPPCCCFFLLSA
jgi:replicative superfamily II helicase